MLVWNLEDNKDKDKETLERTVDIDHAEDVVGNVAADEVLNLQTRIFSYTQLRKYYTYL